MPPDSAEASPGAPKRPENGYAVITRCKAALDAEAFRHVHDAYERAEMVLLAIRASLRRADVSLVEGGTEAEPYRIAYYLLEGSAFHTKLLSGSVLSDGGDHPEAAIERACYALYDLEGFDVARLNLPHFRKSQGLWWLTVKRPGRPRLLICGVPRRTQEILPIGESYEKFLKSLGKYTRRNVRKSRGKAEEIGVRFIPADTPPPASLFDTIFTLAGKNGPEAIPRSLIREKEAEMAEQHHHFHTMMTTKEGEIFSICRGFIWGRCAVLPYQLNDRDHFDKYPSLLHRSYLVEWLTGKGVREIVFPNGCAGLLKNICLPDIASFTAVIPLKPGALAKALLFGLSRAGTAFGLLLALLPRGLRKRIGVGEP